MSRVTEAHLAARRQDILEAAGRVFADRGFATATMAEVAGEAGISPGAIYRYFENKQALVQACFQEGSEQLAGVWRSQVEAASDPRDALVAIAAHSFEEINSEGAEGRTRILLERYLEAIRTGDQDLALCGLEHDALVASLALALERMQASGQLTTAVDPRALGGVLWSFWLGARVCNLIDPTCDVNAQLAALVQLIDASAGARQG